MADAALIDEYLQWRAMRELTSPDLTPQAFMEERVRNIAVDRLESVRNAVRGLLSDENTYIRSVESVLREVMDVIDGRKSDDDGSSGSAASEESGSDDEPGAVEAGP